MTVTHVQEEEAALRLALVCPPRLLRTVQVEVERRAALYQHAARVTPQGMPGISPLTAAYRSVAHDLTVGYPIADQPDGAT